MGQLDQVSKSQIADGKSAIDSAVQSATSAAGELLHSAAYEALQAPTTGLSQIVDNLSGSHLASSTQFMSAPEAAAFGSLNWHAQQIGGAFGQLFPFLLAKRMVNPFLGDSLAKGEINAVAKIAPIGMSVKEAAAAGFVSQALFHPVLSTDKQNFWEQKAVSSSIAAVTMATLTASSFGLNKIAGSGIGSQTGFESLQFLKNPVVNGVISGAPAGFVSTELSTLYSKHEIASRAELGQSIYTMSFMGGAFGAMARPSARAGEITRNADLVANISSEPAGTELKISTPQMDVEPGHQFALPLDIPAHNQASDFTKVSNESTKAVNDALPLNTPAEAKVEPAKQLELEFPAPLTPTGNQAWQLLRRLENMPKEENIKLGAATKDMPVSVEELQAMVILRDEWLPGARRLYSRLSDRSTLAQMIAYDSWHVDSASDVKDALPKIKEKSLILSSEANNFNERDKFVGINDNSYYEPIGIKDAAETKAFLDLYLRADHYNPWLWGHMDVDPVALYKMSKWSETANIPDGALRGITEHFYVTKQEPGGEDVATLVKAAPAWNFMPSMPMDMAFAAAELSPREKVAAQSAFEKAANEFKVGDQTRYAIFTGEKAAEARAAYNKYYEENLGLSTRLLVKSLKVSFGTPNAVEALYGDKLDAKQQRELVIGLDMFRNPMSLLATVDVPTFFEAYNKLVEKYPPEKDSEAKRYFSSQNRSALVLSSVFKKNWQNWLDVQEKAGRDPLQATDLFSADEPANLKGLSQFLLEHGRKSPDQLTRIARNWTEVKKAEAPDYQEALRISLLARFESVQNEPFALEASRWNVGKDKYADMEKRYLASLAVPSPFPLGETWTSGGLTGRFLPRDDVRGLFLGEYSNCCQHPGGNAESSAWYGQENARSGFFVVENAEHEIVAQSWAIATEDGGMIFDNVEAKGIEKRQSAVKDIYQKAAQTLVSQFHVVTMGTENTDLELTELKPAGKQSLTMPSDFSGYTDSKNQVLLASTEAAAKPVEFRMVRGATNLDKVNLAQIARDKFPEGWQHLPWEPQTRGLVVQDSNREIMGYALFEPSNHYVSDLAVKPDAHARYGFVLTANLLKEMKRIGGEWKADMRSTTSYRILQKAASAGRVNIITDKVEDSLMGDDPMHQVVFNVNSQTQRQ